MLVCSLWVSSWCSSISSINRSLSLTDSFCWRYICRFLSLICSCLSSNTYELRKEMNLIIKLIYKTQFLTVKSRESIQLICILNRLASTSILALNGFFFCKTNFYRKISGLECLNYNFSKTLIFPISLLKLHNWVSFNISCVKLDKR